MASPSAVEPRCVQRRHNFGVGQNVLPRDGVVLGLHYREGNENYLYPYVSYTPLPL